MPLDESPHGRDDVLLSRPNYKLGDSIAAAEFRSYLADTVQFAATERSRGALAVHLKRQ